VLALLHLYLGDSAAAWERVNAVLNFEARVWTAHQVMGLLLLEEGRPADAVEAFEKAAGHSCGLPVPRGALACALAVVGQTDRASAIAGELLASASENYVQPHALALACIALGRRDEAFEHLERSCAERDVFTRLAWWNPLFAPLRDDPRMVDLFRRMQVSTAVRTARPGGSQA
jgi:Flp pilus assembly protein TadD